MVSPVQRRMQKRTGLRGGETETELLLRGIPSVFPLRDRTPGTIGICPVERGLAHSVRRVGRYETNGERGLSPEAGINRKASPSGKPSAVAYLSHRGRSFSFRAGIRGQAPSAISILPATPSDGMCQPPLIRAGKLGSKILVISF